MGGNGSSEKSDTSDSCELVIETNNNGVLVYKLSTTIDSQYMNKFHVNVAQADEPYEAKIYCQGVLHAQRALDYPKTGGPPLSYTVNGVPFNDDDDDDEDTLAPAVSPTKVPTASPTDSPTSKPTNPPTFFPTESDKCEDSTEAFKWNNKSKNNKRTCKWLRRSLQKTKKLKKLCGRKDKVDNRRVWDWCPKTCATVGLGNCVA